MPPPTQIMAAVPTALSNVRKTGMPRTRPRPSARLEAADRRGAVVPRQRQTDVVGFHDQRDHAVHRDRDPDPDQRQHERPASRCSRPGSPPA